MGHFFDIFNLIRNGYLRVNHFVMCFSRNNTRENTFFKSNNSCVRGCQPIYNSKAVDASVQNVAVPVVAVQVGAAQVVAWKVVSM